jgi:hypothetical protein
MSMPTFVVELSGGSSAFHRLLGVLHRKHIDFASLIFSGGRAVVVLRPDRRDLALLVAIVEQEPIVVRVDVRVLDEEHVAGTVEHLLRLASSDDSEA